MEVVAERTFRATIEARLRLWHRALNELEQELTAGAPGRRRQILVEMDKLHSKRRAATLKLREIRMRERPLTYDGSKQWWAVGKSSAGQAGPAVCVQR